MMKEAAQVQVIVLAGLQYVHNGDTVKLLNNQMEIQMQVNYRDCMINFIKTGYLNLIY